MLTVLWNKNAFDRIMALGVVIRKKIHTYTHTHTHPHTQPAGVYHIRVRDKPIEGKIGKL